MRKPTFCLCENKDTDQLRGNREADQRLCFHYIDSTIPFLSKSEISSLYPFSVAVQPGLCLDQVGNQNVGFLMTRLICINYHKIPSLVSLMGGSTLALIFRKSWFITVRFHSIHLRACFPQVNVTIARIVFYH